MKAIRARNTRLRLLMLSLLSVCSILVWSAQYRETIYSPSIEMLLKKEKIPGGVLAIRHADETISIRTIGRSSKKHALPLTVSTCFPIASLSKPITAATVRRLIALGHLELDTPAFNILSETTHTDDARYAHITIRHLLQHTSGLNQTPYDPMFDNGIPLGCHRTLEVTLRHKLESNPGERMRYSNAGYCVLEKVIEHVAGNTYADVVHATLELPPDTKLTLGPQCQGPSREGYELPDETWRRVGAAGGWFSDAKALLLELSNDATDPTIPSSATAPYNEWYYGLGWRVWPTSDSYRLTHYGALPGMFSVAVAHPDGRTAVLLLNGRPRNDESYANLLYPLLEKELSQQAPHK